MNNNPITRLCTWISNARSAYNLGREAAELHIAQVQAARALRAEGAEIVRMAIAYTEEQQRGIDALNQNHGAQP